MALITNHPEINSLRLYDSTPNFGVLTFGVCAIAYPQKTSVRDVVDFTPKVKQWLNTTAQSMGNWVSKEATLQSMNTLEIKEVPVYENSISLEITKEFLEKNNRLVVLGFDVLQIPRYSMIDFIYPVFP